MSTSKITATLTWIWSVWKIKSLSRYKLITAEIQESLIGIFWEDWIWDCITTILSNLILFSHNTSLAKIKNYMLSPLAKIDLLYSEIVHWTTFWVMLKIKLIEIQLDSIFFCNSDLVHAILILWIMLRPSRTVKSPTIIIVLSIAISFRVLNKPKLTAC